LASNIRKEEANWDAAKGGFTGFAIER
jgi:hypothetical protein